jgi:hypothetical protein
VSACIWITPPKTTRAYAELAEAIDVIGSSLELDNWYLPSRTVDDIDEKTRVLEEVKAPHFFDGLSEIKVMKLRTIVSDIWRTRLEVSFQEIRQKVPA